MAWTAGTMAALAPVLKDTPPSDSWQLMIKGVGVIDKCKRYIESVSVTYRMTENGKRSDIKMLLAENRINQ